MSINVTLQDDATFNSEVLAFVRNAKQLWSIGAGLVVQAILHYHQNGFDVSRCEQLYTAMVDSGQGGMQAAYTAVLRKTTGISGIGGEFWKGKGRDIPTDWEDPIQGLIDGEGAALMAYKTPPEKKTKARAAKPASVKLPENTTEAARHAFQKAMDSASVSDVQNAIKVLQGESSADLKTQNATLRRRLASIDELFHDLEGFTDQVDDGKHGPETGVDKALRISDPLLLNLQAILQKDFTKLKEAASEKDKAA